MGKRSVDIRERAKKAKNMQLFRVPIFLPLLVLTCWAVLGGVYGTCSPVCKNSGTCDSDACKCDGTGYEGPTCDLDIDECKATSSPCEGHGNCTNTPGSYTCTCKSGYAGDGTTCKETNECKTFHAPCDEHADCTNTGSYNCTCKPGYAGDGNTFTCFTYIDECTVKGPGKHDCHEHADCTNTPGSYNCTCNSGYAGDGKKCTEGVCSKDGKECLNGGKCGASKPPTTCTCASGYKGATCQNAGDTVTISAYLLSLTVVTFFVIQ